MFGLSWGEIALILAVALIAIGPKDLPIAIRTVTSFIKKARGMAAEFQGHVDEMMREANLSDVKTEIDKLRRFDFKTAAEQAVDPDGMLRKTAGEVKQATQAAAASASPVAAPGYTPPPRSWRNRPTRRILSRLMPPANRPCRVLFRLAPSAGGSEPWPIPQPMTTKSTTRKCLCWSIWRSCAVG
jgi:sec-independent protein translocase protein TatB